MTIQPNAVFARPDPSPQSRGGDENRRRKARISTPNQSPTLVGRKTNGDVSPKMLLDGCASPHPPVQAKENLDGLKGPYGGGAETGRFTF